MMAWPSWLRWPWRRQATAPVAPPPEYFLEQIDYWRGRAVEQQQRISELEVRLTSALAGKAPADVAPPVGQVDRVARAHHLAEIQAGDNFQALRAKQRLTKDGFREFKLQAAELVYAIARRRPRAEILQLAVHLENEGAMNPERGNVALEALQRLPAIGQQGNT